VNQRLVMPMSEAIRLSWSLICCEGIAMGYMKLRSRLFSVTLVMLDRLRK
jgi:hypothetical protein